MPATSGSPRGPVVHSPTLRTWRTAPSGHTIRNSMTRLRCLLSLERMMASTRGLSSGWIKERNSSNWTLRTDSGTPNIRGTSSDQCTSPVRSSRIQSPIRAVRCARSSISRLARSSRSALRRCHIVTSNTAISSIWTATSTAPAATSRRSALDSARQPPPGFTISAPAGIAAWGTPHRAATESSTMSRMLPCFLSGISAGRTPSSTSAAMRPASSPWANPALRLPASSPWPRIRT